jgi:iron complex outermembrane receptor protein
MTSTTSRWRFAAAVSPLALMIAATPAFAEDATSGDQTTITGDATAAAAQPETPPPSDTAANAENSDQPQAQKGIVVTGFRAALRSSTAKKKNSETVVESVTAEDIGKLPDNSIAESIARLPGLAAQRNNGRAAIICIRGFGPDFATSTLNGRQQTAANDSRAVEFDQYPSEILAGVDIYKTSEADHTAGGLVGSIDLRTIRPLDYGKRVFAVGVRGTYLDQKLLPGTKQWGGRVFGTFVDQFADDRVGLALSAAYTNEPYSTRDWNAWGYSDYPSGNQGMYGVKTWYETDRLKRLGGTATLQGRLSDNLTMTLDGFYSHFVDDIDQKGFEMPFKFSPFNRVLDEESSNGIVTSATLQGLPLVENYTNDKKADQYSLGWNTLWDGHNGWRALADLSWSRTDRTEHRIETTAGVMYGRDQSTDPNAPCLVENGCATVSYKMTDHGPEYVSDYNAANPALVLTDVEGWSGGSFVQAGYDKVRSSKDDLKEARGEIEREIGSFLKSIKVGVDYTDHSKTLGQIEGFLAPPVGQVSAAIPTSILEPSFTLDRGFGPILSWDPRAVEREGILRFIDNTQPNSGYDVTEKVWTPYVMASLDGNLGAATLTGNVGFQAVHTDLVSTSLAFPKAKDDYRMWLPSLNLNFRWDNGWVVRFAASKQYMRPRLTDLNNAISFHFDSTLDIYNGGGGNPFLRPFQAKAVDLNLEKYFGSKGYVALQTFYKHIDTYIAGGIDENFDYSQFPPPPNEPVPPSAIGRFSGNVNTNGGYMYGAELAGTLPFDIFSPSLDGFGLTGGAGYTKTRIKDFNGNVSVIPGYSKWVANLTAFYEKYGFSVRGSMRYRSAFQGDFVLFSGGLDRQFVMAETIFDAQIGYDFPTTSRFAGLSLYAQGQNLTDERQATLALPDNQDAWLKYQTYGRRFLLGATYKFGQAAPPPPPPPPPPPQPPPPVATQTCADGSVILATDACPALPPPPPPPAPVERGERGS